MNNVNVSSRIREQLYDKASQYVRETIEDKYIDIYKARLASELSIAADEISDMSFKSGLTSDERIAMHDAAYMLKEIYDNQITVSLTEVLDDNDNLSYDIKFSVGVLPNDGEDLTYWSRGSIYFSRYVTNDIKKYVQKGLDLARENFIKKAKYAI